MGEICFVCWRWTPPRTYRSQYAPETVYTLKAMIERHYSKLHRFVCVTDRPDELTGVETVPLWSDCADIPSKLGHSYPSCYRRLKLFAPDAGDTFGERAVSIDLDTVITGNIEHLFDRQEDFVIWGESDFKHTTPYCGSLWMLKTGSRPQVWTQFNEKTSPQIAWAAGCRGSDQGWISHVLKGEATWGRKDGVYSFRKDLKNLATLPENARLISFHGKQDPWTKESQRILWVKQHYQM